MTINYDLLTRLATTTHPVINDTVCDCHNWCGEINQEARVSHHLLDMAGIPHGQGYAQHLDARTYQALMKIMALQDRLDSIIAVHARETSLSGTVGVYCTECLTAWPCDTRRMAEGTYVEEST